MAGAVEANSLSSITQIAANPPKYPRNPSQEVRPSLVLYIARVPGSRDVFLTTIKPRQKVVTAEDVASSLYYLHVDQTDDDAFDGCLAEPARLREPQPTSSPAGEGPRVARKPVPSTPSPTLPAPELPPRPQSESHFASPWDAMSPMKSRSEGVLGSTSMFNAKATKRKPVEGQHGSSEDPVVSEGRRLPLGPRPQVRQQPPASPTHASNGPRDYPDELAPPLPPRRGGALSHSGSESAAGLGSSNYRTAQADHPRRRTDSEGNLVASTRWARSASDVSLATNNGSCSVTLIRRDPASGAQWNVGRLAIPRMAPSTPECAPDTRRLSPAKESGHPIQIEVLNPAYSKFLHSSKASVWPSPHTANNDNLNGGIQGDRGRGDAVFRRQIAGDSVRSWFGHSRKRRSGTEKSLDLGHGDDRDEMLGSSFHSNASPARSNPARLDDAEWGRDRDRGYSFVSPWDGVCEFSAGASGRSLKCKHTLTTTGSSEPAPSASVSELRFNLPITSLGNPFKHSRKTSGSNDSGRSIVPPAEQTFRDRLSSQVSPVLNLVHGADRLDLSLAHEKAGGGPSGKQAKLGKLIIHDEGLKMVDLTVAANMSIWWKVYDKLDIGGD